MRPSLSNRHKAFLAVALALLLWLPQGISSETQPVVTGHSTFYNGDVYDKCLASIAGILRSRVMWFNDMVLVERYPGKGTFIFVTETGAKNPTEMGHLYTEGVYFDFVDPNGAHWHVEEAFYFEKWKHQADTHASAEHADPAEITGNPMHADPKAGADADAEVEAADDRYRVYVWIVELAERPIHDDFAGPVDGPYYHDLYNFVVLVDTCKMNATRSLPYEWWHNTTATLAVGHPTGETAHKHEVHTADVWVGTQPLLVPFSGASTDPEYNSMWAVNSTSNSASRANLTRETNDGYGNQVTSNYTRDDY